MDPELRRYTLEGLIPGAKELLIGLYGSYEAYINGVDYESRAVLEDACIAYSRSLDYVVCAVQALKELGIYEGERDDDAITTLHFHLYKVILNREEDDCSGGSCSLRR